MNHGPMYAKTVKAILITDIKEKQIQNLLLKLVRHGKLPEQTFMNHLDNRT